MCVCVKENKISEGPSWGPSVPSAYTFLSCLAGPISFPVPCQSHFPFVHMLIPAVYLDTASPCLLSSLSAFFWSPSPSFSSTHQEVTEGNAASCILPTLVFFFISWLPASEIFLCSTLNTIHSPLFPAWFLSWLWPSIHLSNPYISNLEIRMSFGTVSKALQKSR